MRSIFMTLAIVGVIGAGAAAAHEGHKHANTKSMTKVPAPVAPRSPAGSTVEKVRLSGELIDPQCWFTHHGEGKGHAECAVMCAEGGQDLAFLDARTGEVYTLLAKGHGKNPNVGLYEHVGVLVRLHGTVYRRGVNLGLIVETVEKVR